MIPQCELKAEDVRQYAIEKLKEYIPMEAHGYCCTTDMIFDVLFKASAECSSVEATCADLERWPTATTIRAYLNQAIELETLRETEKHINAGLASCLPQPCDATVSRSPSIFMMSRSMVRG